MHHHCPSPFYHSESRSHHRPASRADSGNGNSPGIAQAQGNLLEAVPASIQGPVGSFPRLNPASPQRREGAKNPKENLASKRKESAPRQYEVAEAQSRRKGRVRMNIRMKTQTVSCVVVLTLSF